jgi:hypothetical protein
MHRSYIATGHHVILNYKEIMPELKVRHLKYFVLVVKYIMTTRKFT